ncbi:MAG TPA: sigma-70 family RNA polymerase sigma factor [Myxococcales bacterium]|jgi:RNA polymerase sigma-70 factor (ECF subfamily)|nr:sigma-70 family RNA polymerase sigma factor [Myxococcales bacterium]
MDTRDEELIAAAQRGDADAINRLLASQQPRLYRFGLRLCGEEQAAREVLQNTLVAAFRHLPEFRGSASLSTWLFQIARTYCIRERRPAWAGARTVPADSAEARAIQSEAAGPDKVALAREIGELLQQAIQALPPADREALVLRDVEGLSAEEAAARAGIEVGALKSRLHRARRAVRKHLAPVM